MPSALSQLNDAQKAYVAAYRQHHGDVAEAMVEVGANPARLEAWLTQPAFRRALFEAEQDMVRGLAATFGIAVTW